MPITASSTTNGYPDDLADVLQHVALDKRAVTRPKTANHPDTREFLELGLQLLRDDFIDYPGTELDGLERCRLFESVSLNRLLQLSDRRDQSRTKHLKLSPAKFKERWPLKNRYTEDLISYLFRTAPQVAYMDTVARAVESLITTDSFGGVIRQLAAAEIELVLADPLFELHSIIEVTLPKHPRVRQFLRAQEEILLPRWADMYERIAGAYGMELSREYSWLDVAVMLNTMINGLLAQARTSGGSTRTLTNGDNVLVGAIFAMLPTLLHHPTTDWDNVYPDVRPQRG